MVTLFCQQAPCTILDLYAFLFIPFCLWVQLSTTGIGLFHDFSCDLREGF